MHQQLLLLLLVCGLGALNAQTYTVSGTVTDAETGDPLSGASVILAAGGATSGTITDFDGRYTLSNVAACTEISFSYTGLLTLTRTAENGNPLDIAMSGDVQALEEVVVIGYGTQQKRNVTGAVATVDSETIEQLKPVKIEQA